VRSVTTSRNIKLGRELLGDSLKKLAPPAVVSTEVALEAAAVVAFVLVPVPDEVDASVAEVDELPLLEDVSVAVAEEISRAPVTPTVSETTLLASEPAVPVAPVVPVVPVVSADPVTTAGTNVVDELDEPELDVEVLEVNLKSPEVEVEATSEVEVDLDVEDDSVEEVTEVVVAALVPADVDAANAVEDEEACLLVDAAAEEATPVVVDATDVEATDEVEATEATEAAEATEEVDAIEDVEAIEEVDATLEELEAAVAEATVAVEKAPELVEASDEVDTTAFVEVAEVVDTDAADEEAATVS